LGIWKNFEDLEDNLSLPELEAILDAHRKEREIDHKFMAALQGVDMDENENDDAFEQVRRRAEARITGKTEEQVALEEIGIGVTYKGE